MDPFDAIFPITVGHEGGFDLTRSDPGNWTGGSVGSGLLRGTKYGISAASFPTLNIEGLTLDGAKAIYRALYWTRASCGLLPASLALLVFDAAVNNGVGRAVRLLQQTVGAEQDGLFGTATLRAINAALAAPDGLDALRAEFMAQRLVLMASLSTWETFGLGWARRLCRLPYQSDRLGLPANDDAQKPVSLAA